MLWLELREPHDLRLIAEERWDAQHCFRSILCLYDRPTGVHPIFASPVKMGQVPDREHLLQREIAVFCTMIRYHQKSPHGYVSLHVFLKSNRVEVSVNRVDRCGTFADRSRHASVGSGANISRGEDPGNVRFEHKGIPIKGPAAGFAVDTG